MVSQAGAMALAGLLPAVHSFACFLSTRPNEQIYNNATEGTKVIYAGSLAGLVPGGPGHSHQSVRDISALGAMPGMALHRAVLRARGAGGGALGGGERRRTGVHPARQRAVGGRLRATRGRGARARSRDSVLREGGDVLFVAAGPVMVGGAWAAAELLAEDGIEAGVVSLPWLRGIDGAWLAEIADGAPIVTLDNHYVSGGLGDGVLAALAEGARTLPRACTRSVSRRFRRAARTTRSCAAHGLDAAGIAARVRVLVQAPSRA